MSETFRHRVRTTLARLLPRLRQTIEFPLDPKEVYRAAFPESKLVDWMYDPLPKDFSRRELSYRNMISCTHREHVVHFLLNSQSELDDAGMLNSDRAIFWVRFDHPVACPPGDRGFVLDEAVRTDMRLARWYNDAQLMEDTINRFTMKVYGCLREVRNPSEFALAWPEVATAVHGVVPDKATLRAAARSSRISKLRGAILSYFPLGEGRDMDKFTSMLASALLLPNKLYPKVWVGLHQLEERLL